MLLFDIGQLFPGFLLRDKTGYAMAKALERGLNIFCRTVQSGVDIVLDVEKMPEWRLDEMAWELGCLYDYSADIESKRAWIRDAVPIYASYGTVEALYKVLGGYFDAVEVEENWQYGAEPYHFRVTVSGIWTDANEQWARNAVAATKNVRSVLDDIAIGSGARIAIAGDTAYWRFPYEMTAAGRMTGTQPIESTIGRIEDVRVLTVSEAKGQKYPYTPAGTIPQENTVMGAGDAKALLAGEGDGYLYGYPQTGEEQRTGTTPQENMIGRSAEIRMTSASEAKGQIYPYTPAGAVPQENTAGATDGAALHAKSDAVSAVFSYRTASGNTPCGSDEIF